MKKITIALLSGAAAVGIGSVLALSQDFSSGGKPGKASAIRPPLVSITTARIRALIGGQAGALNVHPCSLPEQYLNTVLEALAKGPVMVNLDTADGRKVTGALSFVNHGVETDSGTIKLKARLPNSDRALWPGAFTRVSLCAGTSKDALVLPPQAILEDTGGHFVYTIDDDNKAVSRPIHLLRVQDGDAVVDGIKPGDRIVLEGAQDLRSGMRVRIANPGKTPKGRTNRLAATTSSASRQ